jgi:cystathionine gamma-synthase
MVRLGLCWDTTTGAISTPVYQTATFRHPALGQSTGYDYSRTNNPTRQALEDGFAEIEGGERAVAFASGMAAITALMLLFRPGDHLIFCDDLYGGTYRLVEHYFVPLGLEASFVDMTDVERVERSLRPNTRGIFLETPTNPLLKVIDLAAIIGWARRKGLISIVDNTFMTPYLQRPLEFGADFVVYSATKYLGGHNDLVAGLVVAADRQQGERVVQIQNALGAVPGPWDCWLLIRGIKTLPVRLDRAQATAMELAQFLRRHPRVRKVYYPGLPEHPGHAICLRQARGFGAMLSFEVKNPDLVPQVLSRLKLISFAESLGGVESLITYPETQTHADIPLDMRRSLGINECLLRLSVGLEDPADLQADLAQALE